MVAFLSSHFIISDVVAAGFHTKNSANPGTVFWYSISIHLPLSDRITGIQLIISALVLRHQNHLHLPLFPQHTVCGTDDRVQPDAAEKAGIQPHFCSHLLCLCRAGLRSVPAVLSGTFGSAGGCGFCSKILTLAGYLGVDLGLSHFYTILL